jgi:hypothetical protein
MTAEKYIGLTCGPSVTTCWQSRHWKRPNPAPYERFAAQSNCPNLYQKMGHLRPF